MILFEEPKMEVVMLVVEDTITTSAEPDFFEGGCF